ncbi:unnamed protein product [Lepeophtheirus salmonis]|uniref:(salmon louse) hypothetical protein n=1 Tax=Lepeophtheirus salmonis TaxID=72036 RepID=A0A7R8D4A4_LEPSM|nr:unnamed protein product [Lepeophtheirus salmonis]CAF3024288.1 unnamed protein product [Lepeophtheirus salmonis]
MVRSNRICFTLNNYTNDEQIAIEDFLDQHADDLIYAIVGEEYGLNGTLHLQGYIHFKTSYLRASSGILRYWRSLPGLGRAHIEDSRGSDYANKEYCEKDGIYIDWGSPQESPMIITDRFAELVNGILHGN